MAYPSPTVNPFHRVDPPLVIDPPIHKLPFDVEIEEVDSNITSPFEVSPSLFAHKTTSPPSVIIEVLATCVIPLLAFNKISPPLTEDVFKLPFTEISPP